MHELTQLRLRGLAVMR